MKRLSDTDRHEKGKQRQAGYTLAELLVVLVILGLLIALVAPRVFNQAGNARVRSAEVQVDSLVTALEYFRLDVGRYPTRSEGLDALISPPSATDTWAGPYLERSQVPTDPWGAPYLYEISRDGAPRVYSLGADGQPGGEGENQDVSAPQ